MDKQFADIKQLTTGRVSTVFKVQIDNLNVYIAYFYFLFFTKKNKNGKKILKKVLKKQMNFLPQKAVLFDFTWNTQRLEQMELSPKKFQK